MSLQFNNAMAVTKTTEEQDTYGVIARSYMLLPEQAAWLKRKGTTTQRTASVVLRDLIAKAMNDEAQQAEEKSKAN